MSGAGGRSPAGLKASHGAESATMRARKGLQCNWIRSYVRGLASSPMSCKLRVRPLGCLNTQRPVQEAKSLLLNDLRDWSVALGWWARTLRLTIITLTVV